MYAKFRINRLYSSVYCETFWLLKHSRALFSDFGIRFLELNEGYVEHRTSCNFNSNAAEIDFWVKLSNELVETLIISLVKPCGAFLQQDVLVQYIGLTILEI